MGGKRVYINECLWIWIYVVHIKDSVSGAENSKDIYRDDRKLCFKIALLECENWFLKEIPF
jgi:hypothetical protein